ncbi:sensor histidine kinase KdpD [Ectopseudomonas mendocina]|uniref:histidine kinase n=1 Tax=Ectopseudomonas mendocina TaxID=300 RepID=A0A2R3QRR7_ECTME|nr:HAMP domain-containing sensor histidine kinase [Pseudomonas mendocina]AVO54475.1 sensor histidine kinase [Pseudomonas mendocina]
MSLVNVFSLKQLFATSNFRQASTIAFICLLIALTSIIFSNHLLELVMRSHVRDMILNDVRSQQLHGRLLRAEHVVAALKYREPFENRKERHAIVVDDMGRPLYGDRQLLPGLACQGECNGNWRHATLRDVEGNETEILGLLVPLADGGRYFSAYDLRPMLERTRIIPLIAGAGLLLVLLLILLISLPFSRRNLARINLIHDALFRYASGDHSARAPSARDGDEFDQLGGEINLSLQRIDRLMEEVKTVTSHIAHELRTPLTRLQSRLLSVSEKLEGESRDELLRAVQDSERIQSLFRAVMRVGEVETGRCAHHFEAIKARRLLEDVREYYLPMAEERECPLLIECAPEHCIYGDAALLFQALANLVDNALKYSPSGSPIVLAAGSVRDRQTMSVADRGKGIPRELNAKAMERFSRLDTSGNIPGNGLGLTLTRAICDLHGGRLVLADNQPGLRAILEIKSAPIGVEKRLP